MCLHVGAGLFQPGLDRGIGQQAIDVSEQFVISPFVAVHPDAVPGVVHPLRVVVPIPDERHHERRLAEVERLVEGVVSAVLDDDITVWQDGGLWVPRGEVDVGGRFSVLVESSFRR